MKLNINSVKKGLFLAGLSLTGISISGCAKQTTDVSVNVSINNRNKQDDNDLAVATAKETLEVLGKYNQALTETRLDINDIKYLSTFNNGMFSIKYTDGELYQMDDKYSVVDNGSELVLYPDGNVSDEMSEDSINIGECINEENIEISAYTFPIAVSCSDTAQKKIKEKYGEEVLSCVKAYGLPVAMYDWNDFTSKKVNTLK